MNKMGIYGENKTAVIVDLKHGLSFNNNSIAYYMINNYVNYIKDILKYDKVYIVINSVIYDRLKHLYDKFLIINDIETPDLFIKYKIDDIYIYNMKPNFFGGIIYDNAIYNLNRVIEFYKLYKNNKDKAIYYILDDPRFNKPEHCITNIIQRIFVSKSLKIVSKNDIFLKKELDLLYSNKIFIKEMFEHTVVAFCGIDYNKLHINDKRTLFKGYANFECYIYNGVNEIIDTKLKDYCFENKSYDIVYYGFKKESSRTEYITNILRGNTKKIMLISNNAFLKDVTYDFFKKMSYYDMIPFMASHCKSTLVTHDNIIIGNQISPRFFDSMLSDMIAFIDIRYDTKKELANNIELLEDFMYISSKEEFDKKVSMISNNKLFYKQIKLLQRKAIFEKFKEYIKKENIKKYEDCFKRMQLNIDNKNWNNDIKNNSNIEISDNDNINDLF